LKTPLVWIIIEGVIATLGKPKVYLESSTISYLTARPTEEPIRRAKQILPRRWWEHRESFDLYISETVLDEIAKGDPQAAGARLEIARTIPVLAINDAIEPLAQALLRIGVIPAKSAADADHIAYTAVYGLDILMTWNQRHIAVHPARRLVDAVLVSADFRVPQLLTPEQHLFIMNEGLKNVYYP
jgi:hypothetical protein